MDLMTQIDQGPIKATNVGLGTTPGRTALGLMWLASMSTKVLHSNIRCTVPREPSMMARVPAFSQAGEIWFISASEEYLATLCDQCPVDMDMDWWTERKCKLSKADFFTHRPTQQKKIIETYCDNCPVQLECLEYGEQDIGASQGVTGIYGGIYFHRNPQIRKEEIEARRKELIS